eukprot:403353294
MLKHHLKTHHKILKYKLQLSKLTSIQYHKTEVRAFSNPPRLVFIVMKAIGILLGQQSTEWKDCKALLCRPNFIELLLNLDLEAIPESQVTKLKQFVQKEELTPENVKLISIAAGQLAKFICLFIELREC